MASDGLLNPLLIWFPRQQPWEEWLSALGVKGPRTQTLTQGEESGARLAVERMEASSLTGCGCRAGCWTMLCIGITICWLEASFGPGAPKGHKNTSGSKWQCRPQSSCSQWGNQADLFLLRFVTLRFVWVLYNSSWEANCLWVGR